MFHFKYRWFVILLWLWSSLAHAFETFLVEDIRLEGVRRISVGTVFNYLPVTVGESFSQENASATISALFKTGFFKDIRLEREVIS